MSVDSNCQYSALRVSTDSHPECVSPSMLSPRNSAEAKDWYDNQQDYPVGGEGHRVLSLNATGEKSLAQIYSDTKKQYRKAKCCAALVCTALVVASVFTANHYLKFFRI